MVEPIKRIIVQMVDTDTGEIYYKARKDCTLFETVSGQRYITRVLQSMFRGVRAGKNLSLTIELSSLHVVEQDLFSCNVTGYI